jgi:hypothetical protein
MATQSPFLDVRSFAEAEAPVAEESPSHDQFATPFLAVYKYETEGQIDPQAEAYLSFLNELYDERFNEMLMGLVNEAVTLREANFTNGQADPRAAGDQAERMLTQHFAPLVAEAETMIRTVASELERRDPTTLSEEEVEALVDGYHTSSEINPQFEEWLGGLLKRVVKTGLNLASGAVGAIAKLGLGPILNKLLGLVKPLFKRVVESAIDRLPANLQPMARVLRDKLPFLKELEDGETLEAETVGSNAVAEIQNEFNHQVANLLFAQNETEQDLEVARAANVPSAPAVYPLAELETARERFIDSLSQLKEGEDPTPHVERFIPALLPVLKVGLKLAGRQRVVNFLADFLAKLIQQFVGPQYAPVLSRAMVGAGLDLLHLEAPAEGEARSAASAVASTLEETVQRVAALPDYVLDNQELLEGAALEAFEQAAAANLPPILPEGAYRQRPDLREHRRGFWCRCGRRRYKRRVGAKIAARISPYGLSGLETFDGATVGEALEEQYAVAPGEEVDAQVHLYEALPGMRLSDIVRGEDVIPKVGGEAASAVLHPLTRDAASLLLGQPELGRDVGAGETGDATAPQVGQRFYYLEIPGKRPLTVPGKTGRPHVRHRSRIRFVFHFPKNRIVAHLYLSELRAQHIAVKLRQNAHLGPVMERFRHIVTRGMTAALGGHRHRLKIVHGAVIPGASAIALGRLPSLIPQMLGGRVTEWIVKGLADQLPKRAQEFIQAADTRADGVTLLITLQNPPGFHELGEALKGGGVSLATLKLPDGEPIVTLKTVAGHRHA